MPNETSAIADQLRRVYDSPAWLGPNLKEILSKVTEQKAAQRPIPDAHTIWELVLHITAWLRIARERLSSSEVRDASDQESWPAMNGTWQSALAQLREETVALQQAILAFPADRLDHPAPAAEPQTFYVLLHGVVQHTAYHAGQIALLAK